MLASSRRIHLVVVAALPWLGAATPAQDDHWAYRPLPPAADVDIDAFVSARLAEHGLQPSPRADRATLVRRLFVVLHGLLPTPDDVARAVAAESDDWYEDLVDELLASPRYGERWAQHWLDVVRYADTHGFETNTPRPNAYHYRDWVIDALNRDLPYDRFILEQLAGDSFGADAATGFLVAGPWDAVKSPDVRLTAEQRSNELADMVGMTGTAFLGTTLGCARCHDHKFDPIRQTDYYAVEAVFAGVRHGERELLPDDDVERRARLAEVERRLSAIETELAAFVPLASPLPVTFLDDEDADAVEVLIEKQGHGQNPAGGARGHRDDDGDAGRVPNISRSRYTWWQNAPGCDAIAYRPGLRGSHRVWVSWGCGWDTHTTDAVWLVDQDGDLETRDDQRELAVVDQQRFADGSGDIGSKPLWSGLCDVGVVDLHVDSRIVLRGGASGTALTADVIVLQAVSTAPEDVPRLRPPVNALGAVDRFAPRVAQAVRMTVEATSNGIEPCIDELRVFTPVRGTQAARNVADAGLGAVASASSEYPNSTIHRIAHANDGQVGNSHSWISNEMGKGWLQIEFAEPAVVDRVTWARDRLGRFRDRIPVRYRIELQSPDGAWREVATSDDRVPYPATGGRQIAALPCRIRAGDADRARELLAERRELAAELLALRRVPRGYVGRFEQPQPTRRLHRGDPLAPREVVAPGTIAAFGVLDVAAAAKERERRIALAQWIAREDNPLTARVVVNRIWQHHFGAGFVTTPNDFGRNGTESSHPHLLDALASAFVTGGWSVKRLQKQIVMSATWRQASVPNAKANAVDARGRLLWRFPPRRLEAEAIRDALLQVSGELDLTAGGPGFDVFEPNTNYVRVYVPKQQFGPDTLRRAVYAYRVRMERDPTFGTFDCPDGGQSAPLRARSTTALQAFSLLNSPFVLQRAGAFAARLRAEVGDVVTDQVRRGFALAYQRAPERAELARATSLATEHGLDAFCRALFNTNEFLFVP